MFSVTVRDHMMVAHSFRGEVFGPAQRLHGATYVVDATFRGEDARRRRHRGRHRAGAAAAARGARPTLTYRNLDDEPAFAGRNTSTEVAGPGDRRPAGRAGPRRRARRRRARRWPGSRSRCTSRTSRGRATSGRCDAAVAARRRAGRHRRPAPAERRQRLRPAGLRRAGRARLGGARARGRRRLAVAGRGRARRRWPRRCSAVPDGALVLVDGLVASAAPEVLCRGRRRLRLVVLVHMPLGVGADAAARAARARGCCRGAVAVVTTSEWTATVAGRAVRRCAPDRVHVAQPGRRRRRACGRHAGGRRAALRRRRHAGQGPRRAGRGAGRGRRPAVALRLRRGARPATRLRRPAPRPGRGRRHRATGSASPARWPGRTSTRRTPPPTCSCCLAGRDATAWSSPRRWPAGSRSSRRRSAGCRRRWGASADGARAGPAGRAGRPAGARRLRCGAGSTTATAAGAAASGRAATAVPRCRPGRTPRRPCRGPSWWTTREPVAGWARRST